MLNHRTRQIGILWLTLRVQGNLSIWLEKDPVTNNYKVPLTVGTLEVAFGHRTQPQKLSLRTPVGILFRDENISFVDFNHTTAALTRSNKTLKPARKFGLGLVSLLELIINKPVIDGSSAHGAFLFLDFLDLDKSIAPAVIRFVEILAPVPYHSGSAPRAVFSRVVPC
jgi:hypothetical protein